MKTASTNQVPKTVQLICDICKKAAMITFTIATLLFITTAISIHDEKISLIQNSKPFYENDTSLILVVVSFIFIAIATLINVLILFIALIIAISSKGYSKKVFRSMAYMLINIPIAVAYEILITELL
ncbi:hypothetical protein Q763_08125 [Flavobacterium beibuense F44-8]|uniref:Uncharacterized protein n=1 Tax=Flavobacterium beibuense F44-8 TaxID=1406840 RepID=A0A0A2LQT9_9FLAO|nr:hypothetical protein [Flavobacterium beibuense]KGO81598.1 hypothetical protein Q763_08125 [Flavobacterium beibuense F44-8]